MHTYVWSAYGPGVVPDAGEVERGGGEASARKAASSATEAGAVHRLRRALVDCDMIEFDLRGVGGGGTRWGEARDGGRRTDDACERGEGKEARPCHVARGDARMQLVLVRSKLTF